MNEILLAVIAALLPVGFLVYYIYRKDKDQPEPKKWLWKGGLYGVLSAIIVIVFSLFKPEFLALYPYLEGTVPGALGTSLFDAAIPEEAAKLLMLWILIRKNPYFDEHLDGIVYATLIGLGFAGLENIFYVLDSLDDFVSIALTRAIFSVPGHFFFAVVMGYYVSLAYFGNKPKAKKAMYWALAFIVPMTLHFIFDAILMSADAMTELSGMLIVAFLVFCVWLRKYALKRINAMREEDAKKQLATSVPTGGIQVPTELNPVRTTYTPQPLDTSDVELPGELQGLAESIAENVHDVWSAGRISEGWSFGPVRDDQNKKHPCLVPYDELPDSEKEYDRHTSQETIKMILKSGFSIRKDSDAISTAVNEQEK
ncbi:MAG: PrsW family glutamic-type intramembrane protease [Candidatus Cryptobacteroides sp.]